MRNNTILLLTAVAMLAFGCAGCNKKAQEASLSITPEAGTSYKQGQQVSVKLSYANDTKPDSIVYLVDSTRFASKMDSSAVSLKTDSISLGPRSITAKLYQGGKSQEISTNIVLLAPKAPEEYTFKIEKVYPHDTGSFTEGLLYHDGYLYESTGQPKHSKLMKINLETGKAVMQAKLDTQYFGEGSAIIGDKIIMLTYQDPRFLFVFDKNTFKLLNTMPYHVGVEGWGLCFDGKKLYTDDSTNRIWFLDKDTYRQTGFIDVYDDHGRIDSLNELEYIDGKLYANIWEKDIIVIIDPKTGAVTGRIDLTSLSAKKNLNGDVLNGIAYDKATGRIFLTGKYWDKLYQVKFVKK
ncbi:glutaminyl-peptide cyclotransferase [Mucilaginibacter sp. BT774]|uniref:glutaminyl-peptide cyclotransferase n=1 Tax=Mucilaginibacter sp. BT774 TaxID=3062276 RepID=UPI00267625F2|nr:glutaminyl-peptide cyclotransferase [Mucilaginibacter sp. BT774]MDO3626898.1 glutaminyl-peptide cyclotransferase [Mucilaginibacter sp. BT774]